ncbi:MAG: HTH domain-containing protein [Bacteroidales bacterium]|nr:HTH domain-containing protein [Bacteroidales bacterium]
MERLLSVRDLMDRYQCSRQTAVRHIKRMEHMEKPLMVRASVLEADERERTVKPAAVIREEMMRAKLMRRMA